MQVDGPVSALGRPWRRDDFELHVTAQRMAIERVADPTPDLVEARGSFLEQCVEFHRSASNSKSWGVACRRASSGPFEGCCGGMVNGSLKRRNCGADRRLSREPEARYSASVFATSSSIP